MEYVKMPELLSADAARVLSGNLEAVREVMSPREVESRCGGDEECCCPMNIT